jgi:hypothetical protein
VAWAGREMHLRLGALECSATGAFLRRSAAGQPLLFAGFDVTDLRSRDGRTPEGIDPAPRVRWAAGRVDTREPVG